MAGLRYVAALAVLLGEPLETIDLDSAYLQTKVKATGDYLELSEAVLEGLSDDWQVAVRKARQADLDAGGKGEVVFPLYKNLYGKAPSGTNFITDLQSSLLQLDWVRLPHCPGTFTKFCPITKKPMVIANYVDDFAAVLTKESGPAEWAKLAELWKFDPPRRSERFLGIEMFYPDPKNLRHLILHQSGFLNLVVSRYEAHLGHPLREYAHLPAKDPVWPEEDYRNEAGTARRSCVGGLAYAARGTRIDLMKAFLTLSRFVTRWTDAAEEFLRHVLGYCKRTLNVGLVLDAGKMPKDPREWRIDVSVDASHMIPWCQSGALICLTPASADNSDTKPPFLPIDWVSSGQEYMKLAPAEAETVGVIQAARGGLRYKYSWDEICAVAHPHPMLVRVDNTQAHSFAERGWSPSMMHLPRVYGVNILWVTERIREGIFQFIHEPTKVILADPLTKMRDSNVYFERGVLSRFNWVVDVSS